jgi:hypothetical protein
LRLDTERIFAGASAGKTWTSLLKTRAHPSIEFRDRNSVLVVCDVVHPDNRTPSRAGLELCTVGWVRHHLSRW